VVPILFGSFLDADAAWDNSVFRTDAERHDDLFRNGSSGFDGNADTAEVALAAVYARISSKSHNFLTPRDERFIQHLFVDHDV